MNNEWQVEVTYYVMGDRSVGCTIEEAPEWAVIIHPTRIPKEEWERIQQWYKTRTYDLLKQFV